MESICLEFMDACGKFGDLEKSVRVVDPFVWNLWMHVESARVARGAVESNSSFFSFGHAGAWNKLPISAAQNTNHNGKDP